MKIICVGRNYAEHAAELGDDPPKEPLLFGKFENTLIGDGDAIVLPPEATHVDAEAELALEIGTRGHRIAEADALDHIRGLPRRQRPLGAQPPVLRQPVDAREGLRHVLPARGDARARLRARRRRPASGSCSG